VLSADHLAVCAMSTGDIWRAVFGAVCDAMSGRSRDFAPDEAPVRVPRVDGWLLAASGSGASSE